MMSCLMYTNHMRIPRHLILILLSLGLFFSCSEESHKLFYEDKPVEDSKSVTRLRADIVQNIKVFELFEIPDDVRLTTIKPYQELYVENSKDIETKLQQNYQEETLSETYENAKLILTETESRLFLEFKERLDLFLTSEKISSYNTDVLERLTTDNPHVEALVTISQEEKDELKPLRESLDAFELAIELEELIVSLNVIDETAITSKNVTKVLRDLPSNGQQTTFKKKVEAFFEEDLASKTKRSLQHVWATYLARYERLHDIELRHKRQKHIDLLIPKLNVFAKAPVSSILESLEEGDALISTASISTHKDTVEGFSGEWVGLSDNIENVLRFNYRREDLDQAFKEARSAAATRRGYYLKDLDAILEKTLVKWEPEHFELSSFILLNQSFSLMMALDLPLDRKQKRIKANISEKLRYLDLLKLRWQLHQSHQHIDRFLADDRTKKLEDYPHFISLKDAESKLAEFSDLSRSNVFKKQAISDLKQYRRRFKALLDRLD